MENKVEGYEHVNHPAHYNSYSMECIDMMAMIWGAQARQ